MPATSAWWATFWAIPSRTCGSAPTSRRCSKHTTRKSRRSRWCSGSWPDGGRASGDVVERIWQLEGFFREAAVEIGHLVAHVGDYGVAAGGDLLPGWRFEIRQLREMGAVRREKRLLITGISGGPEISLGRRPFAFRPSRDEKD